MDDTLYKLQKLERERHELYKRASHGQLDANGRQRLSQIGSELEVLWNQHRREDAAKRWGPASMARRKNPAA